MINEKGEDVFEKGFKEMGLEDPDQGIQENLE